MQITAIVAIVVAIIAAISALFFTAPPPDSEPAPPSVPPTGDPDREHDGTPTHFQRVKAAFHRVTVWPGWMQITAVATTIAAIAALFFTARTLQSTNDQLEITRAAAITESLSKAAERLGAELPEVRMAGIYILERLANEAPTPDRP
ncbi:hypothetical protein [Nocardia brasiliensis]|uniref:hypothetical protein n=1 Tax=Nocardia brasiliensis TaxID=37326 RepID=UPI00366DB12A